MIIKGIKRTQNILKFNLCTLNYSEILLKNYFEKDYYQQISQECSENTKIQHNMFRINGNKIDIISIPKFHNEQTTTNNFFTLLQYCRDCSEQNEISLIGIDPYYHICDKINLKFIEDNQFNFLEDSLIGNQNDFNLNNTNIQDWIDNIQLDLKVFDQLKAQQYQKQYQQDHQEKNCGCKHDKYPENYYSQIFDYKNQSKIDDIKQRQQDLQQIILERVSNKEEIETLEFPLMQKAIDFSLGLKKNIFLGELPKFFVKKFMAQHYSMLELEEILESLLQQSKNQQKINQIRHLFNKEFFYKQNYLIIAYQAFLIHQLVQQKQKSITVFVKNYQSQPLIQIIQHLANDQQSYKNFINSFSLKLTQSSCNNTIELQKKQLILSLLYWENNFQKYGLNQK
ncbi:hypothetical protein TTHERM_00343850 (macronuclear) [Tetrahymena thermophila SB210]|uniref:Uncharacterized protein n=1 Tax=Tetrahymena thermophila (strain SB210) TaxID=312017 RepID=I7MEZ4_TETTS|nr:hypothetical protein TTHERM_00343850 [Tetrahymena thermophila SB210]EAR98185.2 hypothetical protein TTHERM_00343850 [Tetrahymena thermophila SB210]|eukprot:XP_001018430.2 hypothetical protein TTHERM_00343850 [Tetrahymena thermophila SB210]